MILQGLLSAAILLAQPAQEAIETFRHFEQDLFLHRSGDSWILVSNRNDQDPRYRPDRGANFKIKTYWVPESEYPTFVSDEMNPARRRELFKTIKGVRYFRLFVHPESEKFYEDLIQNAIRAEDYDAIPTASARSLIVEGPDSKGRPFIAKVSLDAKVGHVDRKIKSSEVARSLTYAQMISRAQNLLPETFVVFPEVAGGYWRGQEVGGQIIREFPEGVLEGETKVLPFFALFRHDPEIKMPWLVKLIRDSGVSPRRFVRENILQPYAKQWMDLALNYGFVSEDHGQNLLLELDSEDKPTGRFVRRDFGGFFVDFNHWRRRVDPIRRADLPSIRSEGDVLYQHRVTQIFREDLRDYFIASILHDLGTHLRRWKKDGIIYPDNYTQEALELEFLEELEIAFKQKTGKDAAFYFELTTMQNQLKVGRRALCSKWAKQLGSRKVPRVPTK